MIDGQRSRHPVRDLGRNVVRTFVELSISSASSCDAARVRPPGRRLADVRAAVGSWRQARQKALLLDRSSRRRSSFRPARAAPASADPLRHVPASSAACRPSTPCRGNPHRVPCAARRPEPDGRRDAGVAGISAARRESFPSTPPSRDRVRGSPRGGVSATRAGARRRVAGGRARRGSRRTRASGARPRTAGARGSAPLPRRRHVAPRTSRSSARPARGAAERRRRPRAADRPPQLEERAVAVRELEEPA